MKRSLTIAFLFVAVAAFAASLVAYRPYHVFGNYYSATSLGHRIFTEFVVATNGRSVELTASRTATNATWNTNFIFYGASNITALSLVQSNTGHDWTKFRQTLISPVVSLGAGHAPLPTNSYLLFVDRTNGQHWRQITAVVSRYNEGTNDYCLSALSAAVPVESMPVAVLSNLSSRLPAGVASPLPIIQHCQHGRVASDFITLGSAHGWESGDSGSGAFVVASNRCIYVPVGMTAARIGDLNQWLEDVNTVTAAAGHDTNLYQPQLETFTNWPTYPYP